MSSDQQRDYDQKVAVAKGGRGGRKWGSRLVGMATGRGLLA